MKSICIIFLFYLSVAFAQAQDVDAIMQTADSLANQPEKALEILNQAVTAHPDSEEILKVRAEAYESLRQFDKAVDDYKKLTVLSPDEENLWYLLGRNLYKNKQYPAALQSLNHAIKLNPQYLPAYHVRIETLLEMNQPEAALRVSDSTLMIGETAMNYFLQGEVNKRLNARQKAGWAYERATRIDKGMIEAYIALADLNAGMNKAEETLTNADAALGINPDSQEALVARSRGFALLKQYKDAIDDASFAIQMNPENVQAHFWRGTYYKETNKYQEALNDFEFVLKIEPDNWQALSGRADSYLGLGNKTSALADYQKLLAVATKYPEKETIIQLANQRIFELNRENRAPQLALTDQEATDKFEIQVPDNQQSLTLKGKITDESPISKLLVNGQEVPITKVGDEFEFSAVVNLENLEDLQIEVADVYDNVNKLSYQLVRNETAKPQIALFTPKPDEKGSIIITSENSSSLYIEGKVNDESTITSIFVDGKAVDFDHNTNNPNFSSIVDISNKTSFSIKVSDSYGNITEQIYTLEKITASADEKEKKPMPEQNPAIEQASH
ncbi:MAG: tetratricopeptide repeat protein [Bacteroidales bacterium]|jgi:tetratricopeptide (TPR) repeat protein|nr:tetratricopeptide repeat protein [Bacteroidales bacterium]